MRAGRLDTACPLLSADLLWAARPSRCPSPVIVPAETAAATKRIAKNDYEVPPRPGIPGWAIVPMVLAGLILFSIWALILRRSHAKNLGSPSDS
jgi:hypothetical protein